MTNKWVPLSARGKSQEKFDSLHEGVPQHLRMSLMEWLSRIFFLSPSERKIPGSLLRTDALMNFERRTRTVIPWKNTETQTWAAIASACHQSDDLTLDLVDFALHFALRRADEFEAPALANILASAGSAWTVAEEEEELQGLSMKIKQHKLERRVLDPIATASRSVMTSTDRAGQHLTEAWNLIYGRHPDPNGAFLEAVRAVEAAMVPIITPNDEKATLGKMLNAMKAQSDKLHIDMSPEPNSVDPFHVVHSMCQLIWKAQPERHGTPEERARSNVSQKSAEGAVHLATTIVQWFTSGVVRRK